VMAVRLSALRAGKFLVLISVTGWVDPRAIVRLEGLGQLKTNDLIRNWTRDLPACSIVPQPTTLPRTPFIYTCISVNNGRYIHLHISNIHCLKHILYTPVHVEIGYCLRYISHTECAINKYRKLDGECCDQKQ
jgi:hypothetical protein